MDFEAMLTVLRTSYPRGYRDFCARRLARACGMAIDLKQHLFDTLYHAVALEAHDAVLITADERYFRATRSAGGIARLKDWSEDMRSE